MSTANIQGDKSQMSKTAPGPSWRRGRSLEGEQELAEQAKKLEDKMNRGFGNSMIMKQQMQNRTRALLANKPDIEAIHKKQEEDHFQKWSQQVQKANKKQKYMEKAKKDANQLMRMKEDKIREKFERIAVVRKDDILNFKEKCQKLNEKQNKIEERLKARNDKIDVFTQKHKQINELRMLDLGENLDSIKDQNF